MIDCARRLAPLALLAGISPGCGSEPAEGVSPAAVNVVLIVADTVRADHLGVYGYERPTSPRIDAFAGSATLYTRAFASAPWTLPTHASLFTGLDPSQHGAVSFAVDEDVSNAYPLPLERLTLAEALAARGFATAGFAANTAFLARRLQLDQGFQTWEVHRERARAVNRRVLPWLEAHRDGPFLLFVNYMDSHRPYHVSPRADFDPPRDLRILDQLRQQAMAGDGPVSDELVRDVIDQYDTAVSHTDAAVGELLDALEDMGLWDESVVVVTSDHGEYFGEHGLVEHSKDIYQEALWIPLAIKSAGQRAGRRVDVPVSSAQVTRMIVGELGPELAGELAPLFPRGPGDEAPIAENRYSRTADLLNPHWGARFRRVRRALFAWPYKYIQSSDGRHELYDLERDPREASNLIDREPERAARMDTALRARIPPDVENRAAPRLSPEEREELRELGYLE